MKRIICVALALFALLLASCGGDEGEQVADKLSVGVIVSSRSDSYLDMESGLLEGLEEVGLTRESADIVCKYAGYEGYPIEDICASMAGGEYDAVVCIGAAAAEAFVALESETPCFVCGISTIYEIGLTETYDPYVTGVLDSFPAEATVELARALTPEVEKFGLLYTLDPGAHESAVNDFCQYLDSVQIDYTLRTATDQGAVTEVAAALIDDGADAIFVPSDKWVHSEMGDLTKLCCERGIPVYSSETAGVKLGALAAVSVSDREMGHQAAELVSRYFAGESVSDMPFICGNADFCAFNDTTADRISARYPSSAAYKTVRFS